MSEPEITWESCESRQDTDARLSSFGGPLHWQATVVASKEPNRWGNFFVSDHDEIAVITVGYTDQGLKPEATVCGDIR